MPMAVSLSGNCPSESQELDQWQTEEAADAQEEKIKLRRCSSFNTGRDKQ